jgi:hypothetical protein
MGLYSRPGWISLLQVCHRLSVHCQGLQKPCLDIKIKMFHRISRNPYDLMPNTCCILMF